MPSWSRRFCNGVGPPAEVSKSPAIFPSSVAIPVATTRPFARPRVTVVPAWTIFRRSPSPGFSSFSGAVSLATGKDSPVNGDSSTSKPSASTKRASAGTRSPVSRTSRSPGTTCTAGMTCSFPVLRTRACGADNSFKACSERSARYSWTKPKIALRKTMARIVKASSHSPSAPEMITAPSSTKTIKSANSEKNRRQGENFSLLCRRFSPKTPSLLAASWGVRPAAHPRVPAKGTPNSFAVSSGDIVHQCFGKFLNPPF